MKVSSKPVEVKPPDFTPFELTLRFDTKGEAEKFFFLFNYVPIIESVGVTYDKDVRELMNAYSTSLYGGFDQFEMALRARLS